MGNCLIKLRSKMPTEENPPEPIIPDRRMNMVVSLHDYPAYGLGEFTMRIGERLTILSDDGDFMMVKSTTSGKESYIPTDYTARVTNKWLFTGISRAKAEQLLLLPNNESGAFIVRDSQSNRDCYSLSVLKRAGSSYLDSVKHYRISRLQNGWLYISPSITFPSLHHLVQHYSESGDGLCCVLREPCFIQGSINTTENAMPLPMTIRRPTFKWRDTSRSMIFRKRTDVEEDSLVSEGLREAITSYLYMTGENNGQYGSLSSWDT